MYFVVELSAQLDDCTFTYSFIRELVDYKPISDCRYSIQLSKLRLLILRNDVSNVFSTILSYPEDVDITSLDVDSAGQVWAVSKTTDTQSAIRVYLPGYKATILTGAILSHVRVVPSLRLLFYVEQSSSNQPPVVKKKIMDVGSDPTEVGFYS